MSPQEHYIIWHLKRVVPFFMISVATIAFTIQHVKDPTKCTKVCAPVGYDGDLPSEFPEGIEPVTCQGDYCAKASRGDEACQPHHSCSVHCSEVCCICLRECV